jgi:hypothetical protein
MRSAFAERLVAAIESVTGGFPTKRRSPTIIVGTDARMRLLAAELEAADKQVSLISLETASLSDSEASGGLGPVTRRRRDGADCSGGNFQ